MALKNRQKKKKKKKKTYEVSGHLHPTWANCLTQPTRSAAFSQRAWLRLPRQSDSAGVSPVGFAFGKEELSWPKSIFLLFLVTTWHHPEARRPWKITEHGRNNRKTVSSTTTPSPGPLSAMPHFGALLTVLIPSGSAQQCFTQLENPRRKRPKEVGPADQQLLGVFGVIECSSPRSESWK